MASAGGAQRATPTPLSGAVCLFESTVNVAVPVALPFVFPVGALTPTGWILSDNGSSYWTVPPLLTTFRKSMTEKLILEFSGVTVGATGDEGLFPRTPSPRYSAQT